MADHMSQIKFTEDSNTALDELSDEVFKKLARKKNNIPEDRLIEQYYSMLNIIRNQAYISNNKTMQSFLHSNKYLFKYTYEVKFNLNTSIKDKIREYSKKIGRIIICENNKEIFLYLIQSKNKDFFAYLYYKVYPKSISFEIIIYSQKENDLSYFEEELKNIYKEYIIFEEDNSFINICYYILNSQGQPFSLDLLEEVETTIPKINYPFIENIDKLIDDYFQSKSSILFLIGSPGTGKTRFIRYLLSNLNRKASVFFTSDKAIIEHGAIFTDFIQASSNVLVLEDFDFHLNSRKEGNTIMYHLLGLSDGLIQSMNKKIIISTNLSNLNNIDEAVLRKGRCFDILNFRLFLWDEVIKFFEENNYSEIISRIEEKEYSLADLYHILDNRDNRNKKIYPVYKKIGF